MVLSVPEIYSKCCPPELLAVARYSILQALQKDAMTFPLTDQGCPTWDGSEGDPHPTAEGREEDEEEEDEEEEWREGDVEHGLTPRKRIRTEESLAATGDKCSTPPAGERDPATPQPRPSPSPSPTSSDNPVCAKNISLTPSGEKVILWTR